MKKAVVVMLLLAMPVVAVATCTYPESVSGYGMGTAYDQVSAENYAVQRALDDAERNYSAVNCGGGNRTFIRGYGGIVYVTYWFGSYYVLYRVTYDYQCCGF